MRDTEEDRRPVRAQTGDPLEQARGHEREPGELDDAARATSPD